MGFARHGGGSVGGGFNRRQRMCDSMLEKGDVKDIREQVQMASIFTIVRVQTLLKSLKTTDELWMLGVCGHQD